MEPPARFAFTSIKLQRVRLDKLVGPGAELAGCLASLAQSVLDGLGYDNHTSAL
jgi:hypothetical protein